MAEDDNYSLLLKIQDNLFVAKTIGEDGLINSADNNKKHSKAALLANLADYVNSAQSSSDENDTDSSNSSIKSDGSNNLFNDNDIDDEISPNDFNDDSTLNSVDDDNTDPNSKAGILKQIQKELEALVEEMKKNPFTDRSVEIAKILTELENVGGNMVADDAEAETAMAGYAGGMANVQNYLADQSGKADQDDINPYTGEPNIDPKTGKPVQVTASVALEHELSFLSNNPKTPYELNADGSPKTYKDSEGNTQYVKNPLYSFFNDSKNKALTDSMESNINSLVNSLTDGNYKPSMTGDPGYKFKDGKLVPGSGSDITIPDGAIKNAWDKANDPKNPDSTLIKKVQSAAGSFSTTLTSGSSALQAIAKADTQLYETEQSTTNNFYQDWISTEKIMQKAQVSG